MYKNTEEKPFKQKKKLEFLEAGFALFSTRNIESVTLQEVADKSGYGVATLYRYFDNKSILLVEIARWKWGAFLEGNMKRRPTPNFEGRTAADMFSFYLDSFLEIYRNNKALLRFNQFFNIYIRSEDMDTDTLNAYQSLMEPIIGFFHEMYERARQDHTVRTDITEEEMLSTTIHLMLAAVTRYAVGLVYKPEGGFDEIGELETLKEVLMMKYTSM